MINSIDINIMYLYFIIDSIYVLIIMYMYLCIYLYRSIKIN